MISESAENEDDTKINKLRPLGVIIVQIIIISEGCDVEEAGGVGYKGVRGVWGDRRGC